MTIYTKKNGIWKDSTPYIKDNGVWKKSSNVYTKDNGVWKTTYIQAGGVDESGYSEVLYVNDTGSDSTGDGSSGNPYSTILKAASVCLDNSLIYVGDGTYICDLVNIGNKDKAIDIVGNKDQTILNIAKKYTSLNMAQYVNIINLTIDGFNWEYGSRCYATMDNYTEPKYYFKNVLFNNTSGIPNDYPIGTSVNANTGIRNKDIYYEYCTFVPQFTLQQYQADRAYGHYYKCVATSSFIVDADNNTNATLADNYDTTGSSTKGIYHGSYPW